MTDEEGEWAQPAHRGRPLVVAIVAVSASVTVLLLLPVPDGLRRWIVLGLVGVLIALQVVLFVRTRRDGGRPLSPKSLRLTHQVGLFWGLMTSWFYAGPGFGDPSSPFSAVVSGALAAALFGVFMWFADPAGPPLRRMHPPARDTTPPDPRTRTTGHDSGQPVTRPDTAAGPE